jgi:transcriptional antiterminator RfaH
MNTIGNRWYLLRTKQYKEQAVRANLSLFLPDIFLPLLRNRIVRNEKTLYIVQPLFPCYVFAYFDLKSFYPKVQRTPGVVGLVRLGGEPAEVDSRIIEQIRIKEGPAGTIELPQLRLNPGQRIHVSDGPLRGFEAVFEGYLSREQRVAILLDTVGANIRIAMPASHVSASTAVCPRHRCQWAKNSRYPVSRPGP